MFDRIAKAFFTPELGSSYVPFGALAILIATTDEGKKNNRSDCKLSILR